MSKKPTRNSTTTRAAGQAFPITPRSDGRFNVYVPPGYAGRKAVRKTFSRMEDARVFRGELLKAKLEREMPEVFTPAEMTELASLREVLLQYGISVAEACRRALVAERDGLRAVTLGELKVAHLESLEKLGASRGHVNSITGAWRHLLESPKVTGGITEESAIAAVTTAMVEALCWKCAASGSRTAFMSWRNKMACIFGFAGRMGWLPAAGNPVRGVARFRKKKRPGIIAAADYAKVLAHFEGVPERDRDGYWLSDFTQWVVCGLAGLRHSEVVRLKREDIVWSEGKCGVLHVENRKMYGELRDEDEGITVEERAVTVQPNLRAWLESLPLPDRGLLCPHWPYKRREAMLAKLGVVLSKDALRHSFATHHAAHFRDKAALMADMGHTTLQVTYEHYVRYVPPSEGEKWWKVRPGVANSETRIGRSPKGRRAAPGGRKED